MSANKKNKDTIATKIGNVVKKQFEVRGDPIYTKRGLGKAGLAIAGGVAGGTALWHARNWLNNRGDWAEAERIQAENDERIRKRLLDKALDPNATYEQKEALMDPTFFSKEEIDQVLLPKILSPETTVEEKEEILNSNVLDNEVKEDISKSTIVQEPGKLDMFYNYIQTTPAAAITGGALATAGLAGIYYLWKKWRDSGKIEAEDIKVANKIDER